MIWRTRDARCIALVATTGVAVSFALAAPPTGRAQPKAATQKQAAPGQKAAQTQNTAASDNAAAQGGPPPGQTGRATKEPLLHTAWKTLFIVGVPIALTLALIALGWAIRRMWLKWLRWKGGGIAVPVFSESRAPPTDGGVAADPGDPDRARTTPDPLEMTTRFRERLATVALQPPTAVPGAASSHEFLDVVRAGTGEATTTFARVAGFLGAVFPPSAYEVHGVMLKSGVGDEMDGLTVQVVVPGRGARDPRTIRAPTPDLIADRAAHAAAASILPLTKHCRDTPWASWYRRDLSPKLLGAYLRAQEFREQRRYDECMGEYYEMLRLDPLNLRLRLELGQLQEKLSLYLDALWTYLFALELPAPPLRRRLGLRRATRWGNYARREATLLTRYRYSVLLGFGTSLAKQWQRTAEGDWTRRDHERRQVRAQLRDALMRRHRAVCHRRSLEHLFAEPPPGRTPENVEWRLRMETFFHAAAGQEARRLWWALLRERRPSLRAPRGLTRRSVRMVVNAWAPYHWRRSLERYRERIQTHPRATVARDAATDAEAALNAARTAFDEAEAATTQADREKALSRFRGQLDATLAHARWAQEHVRARAVMATMERAVAKTRADGRIRRWGVRMWRWVKGVRVPQDMPVAVPLRRAPIRWLVARRWQFTKPLDRLPQRLGPPATAEVITTVERVLYGWLLMSIRWLRRKFRRKPRVRLWIAKWQEHYNAACTYATTSSSDGRPAELAERAVEHLKLVGAKADSGTLSGLREWILSSDPDLAALRPHDSFRAFEARFYPAEREAPLRPKEVQLLQMARYKFALLHEAARRLERLWHLRAEDGGAKDIHDLREWWRGEVAAWECVRQLTIDHRHWQTRLDARRTVDRCLDRSGVPRMVVGHPRYADNPIKVDNRLSVSARIATLTKKEERERAGGNAQLRALKALLAEGGRLMSANEAWRELFTDWDASLKTLAPMEIRKLSRTRAALWQRLAEWFGDTDRPDRFPADRERFEACIRDVVPWDNFWLIDNVRERVGAASAANGRPASAARLG